jgi:hypothetical protein
MYYIIENKEQIDYLKETVQSECFINIITLNDNYHNKLTTPSLVYYKPLNDKAYIICIDHSESFSLDFQEVIDLLSRYQKIFLLNKKAHLYFLPRTLNLIDLNFYKLELDNEIVDVSGCDTAVHNHFNTFNGTDFDVNRIIPISKHFEKQENIFNKVKDLIQPSLTHNKYNDKHTEVFFDIEKNGILLNMAAFKENFKPTHAAFSIKNNKIYSSFNLYNLTTRPTNHFNNVNFSAVPKNGNARASFIPENDTLVEFDFDGYHPRIIADIIGVKFSAKSAHAQLAGMYYSTPNPSQDQIDSAKKMTFKQLYGGIDAKYQTIPFFAKTSLFIDEEWDKFLKGKSKLAGGRKIINNESMNKQKYFNYIIQSYETSNNVQLLSKVLNYLEGKKSKLIHYTYDSFLFDVSKSEGSELLRNIKNILEEHFPVKMSYGKNYKNMIKFQ